MSDATESEFLFEQVPFRLDWIFSSVVALGGIIAAIVGLTGDTRSSNAIAILGLVITALGLVVTIYSFRKRKRRNKFYTTHFVIHDGQAVRRLIAFKDLENVSFGFTGDNDQELKFSAADRFEVLVGYHGEPRILGPEAITREKFLTLRDIVYDAVAKSIIARAQAKPFRWFGNLSITPNGIQAKDVLHPWEHITFEPNNQTGNLCVRSRLVDIGNGFMVHNNIVAGLHAAAMLQAEAAA